MIYLRVMRNYLQRFYRNPANPLLQEIQNLLQRLVDREWTGQAGMELGCNDGYIELMNDAEDMLERLKNLDHPPAVKSMGKAQQHRLRKLLERKTDLLEDYTHSKIQKAGDVEERVWAPRMPQFGQFGPRGADKIPGFIESRVRRLDKLRRALGEQQPWKFKESLRRYNPKGKAPKPVGSGGWICSECHLEFNYKPGTIGSKNKLCSNCYWALQDNLRGIRSRPTAVECSICGDHRSPCRCLRNQSRWVRRSSNIW